MLSLMTYGGLLYLGLILGIVVGAPALLTDLLPYRRGRYLWYGEERMRRAVQIQGILLVVCVLAVITGAVANLLGHGSDSIFPGRP
jgi:hypothetical protein